MTSSLLVTGSPCMLPTLYLMPSASPSMMVRRHRKVHELALQMHLLYTEGKGAAALREMQALCSASQELVDDLKRLMSKDN